MTSLVSKLDRDKAAQVLRDHGSPVGLGDDAPDDEYDCCIQKLVDLGWGPDQATPTDREVVLKLTNKQFEVLFSLVSEHGNTSASANKQTRNLSYKLWDIYAQLHPEDGPYQ